MKLCLVGGFLGSGKTTAISTAAKMFAGKNIPLAVITNDQGSQLVDAAFMDSLNVPGTEVKNGCFCCNYRQFESAIGDLERSIRPEIIFAEAVGSCADLVATIVKPLLRFQTGVDLSLSVFADGPVLLSSLEGRSSFVSDDIQYIYKKQLEEAGLIVINKCDLLSYKEMETIESILASEYPSKKLLFQDSKDERSVKKWLDTMKETSSRDGSLVSIDYQKYGAGEAALAWLDGFVSVHSKGNAVQKAHQFIRELFDEICYQKLTIGHLKFLIQTRDRHEKISYTSNEPPREGDLKTEIIADSATVIVNARVETKPDQLKQIFYHSLKNAQDQNSNIEVLKLDAFLPDYPKPSHRILD